jgi:hypothetical protein
MLKTRLMTVPACMENAGPGLEFNRGNYQNIKYENHDSPLSSSRNRGGCICLELINEKP